MVQHTDELSFGAQVEPDRWVPTVDDWVALWKRERYAMALLPPALYQKLVADGLPMVVIAHDLRRVVVAKPQSCVSSRSGCVNLATRRHRMRARDHRAALVRRLSAWQQWTAADLAT